MKLQTFQHVLVLFDFSENAKIALKHGSVLAKNLGAKISLLNVMEDFSVEQLFHSGKPSSVSFDTYKTEVLSMIDDETRAIRAELGVEIGCYIQQGKVVKQLGDFIKANEVDLVVIGTHGVKGRDPIFSGPNAYKIVNSQKIPVLTVPGGTASPYYKKIFLPLDGSFHTREKLPYAMWIAEKSKGQVVAAAFETHQDKESLHHMQAILQQTIQYMQQHQIPSGGYEKETKNLAQDTLLGAEVNQADLIVIMSEQEKTLAGIFSGPIAQQIVQNSTLPVLTIPPRVSLVMTNVSI